jgi:hypothetical protein
MSVRLSKKSSYKQPKFLNFITAFKPKLFIFYGGPWYVLLIKHDLVKEYQKVPISRLFNIYFFEIQGVPSILLTSSSQGIIGE